jgi:hypothetical protein
MCWIREVGQKPNIVATDNGCVILQGCALTFTGMSLSLLTIYLHRMLANPQGNFPLPAEWLGIDCAHVVKLLFNIPCLKDNHPLVKPFDMDGLYHMIVVENLHDFFALLQHVCVLAL